ncbi:MAG: hypothetical protein LBK42_11150 [Propionibacteriaceae bacterium]|jgi:hypothetical protein|nr:hypothetical protein [Propionibacteriaceae bacterium]
MTGRHTAGTAGAGVAAEPVIGRALISRRAAGAVAADGAITAAVPLIGRTL